MSAEPAPSREGHIIPQGILEVSIKITNEPPTGMMANVHKALDNFNQVNLTNIIICKMFSTLNFYKYIIILLYMIFCFQQMTRKQMSPEHQLKKRDSQERNQAKTIK